MPKQLRRFRNYFFAYSFLYFIGSSSLQAASSPANLTNQIGADTSSFQRRSKSTGAENISLPQIQLPSENEPVEPTEALKEFYIKKINLEGVNAIPLDHLEPILARFENKNLNLVKLYAIAKNITDYYRLKGYITSRAFVPPQEIKDGTVTIRVVEGKFGKVFVQGNRHVKTHWLIDYIALKYGEVLQYAKLMQGLIAMNRNPDRQVTAALSPGAAPESSDITLNVKEQNPLHFVYSIDDYGTKLSGRIRQGLMFSDTNVFGHDDELDNTFNVSDSGGFIGEAVNYTYPISPTGGRFNLSYSYAHIALNKKMEPSNVRGGANTWGVGYVQPIIDEPNWSFNLNSGIDIKDVWSTTSDQKNPTDRVRVLRLGPDLQVRDDWGTTVFRNDFNYGDPDLVNGNGHRFYVDDISLSRQQKFFWSSIIMVHFQAQMTGDSLVSVQQLQAGGYDTVRGYNESDSLGDYGFIENTEWRIPPYFLPKGWRIPWHTQTFWETVQFVTFFDTASVHMRYPAAGSPSERNLMGVGEGIRISVAKSINAQIDWGWPIGDLPADGSRSGRLHFGVYIPF